MARMSYLVLARKYRSRDFEALVGQEHVVQALSNALTQQRLHHAYLFTGTRGVGKTSVSRILAKALNCTGADGQGGITAHPCGVCDACRDIDSGRFVDYVELDAASNRGVEEISQLLDQAVYKPVMGRFKVYLIDEVHMLSNTAFNAMLKTLEEPPEYLKFVLATTDPQKVPPTVLSRCLQFNLRPMAPQTVLEHLGAVLAAEGIPAEPGALRLLSRAARGSMRDALSLTDQAIAFGAGALTEAGVRQMLGAVDRSHAVRLVEALAAGQGADVVAATNDLRSLGLSASGTLEEMAELLQQADQAKEIAARLNDETERVIETHTSHTDLELTLTGVHRDLLERNTADVVYLVTDGSFFPAKPGARDRTLNAVRMRLDALGQYVANTLPADSVTLHVIGVNAENVHAVDEDLGASFPPVPDQRQWAWAGQSLDLKDDKGDDLLRAVFGPRFVPSDSLSLWKLLIAQPGALWTERLGYVTRQLDQRFRAADDHRCDEPVRCIEPQRPSKPRLVIAGWLGRKSGRGFYQY